MGNSILQSNYHFDVPISHNLTWRQTVVLKNSHFKIRIFIRTTLLSRGHKNQKKKRGQNLGRYWSVRYFIRKTKKKHWGILRTNDGFFVKCTFFFFDNNAFFQIFIFFIFLGVTIFLFWCHDFFFVIYFWYHFSLHFIFRGLIIIHNLIVCPW